MQRLTGTCLVGAFLTLAALPCIAEEARAGSSEEQAIRAVVLDYVEGWYSGDAARVERALHPSLVKRGLLEDDKTGRQYIQPTSASALARLAGTGFGLLREGEVMDNRITVVDIHDAAASVTAVSLRYVDYLHLVRWRGEWRILNVLWVPRQADILP